jgi:hypothetical protein
VSAGERAKRKIKGAAASTPSFLAPLTILRACPRSFYFVLSCLAFTSAFSFVCFGFVMAFRNTNIVKLSQPTFLALMPIGGLFMSAGILILLGPPTDFTCRFRFFIFNVAFSFTFSCFLWKVHRAYIIAKGARHAKKVRFTNSDMYVPCAPHEASSGPPQPSASLGAACEGFYGRGVSP